MDIMKMLKRCEVFVGLDDNDLQKIASLSSWQNDIYDTGEFIFHENAVAKNFYILESGEISLVIALYKEESKGWIQTPVDNITKGDIFGWSSLVSPNYLTTSAICTKPSSILMVDGAELGKLLDDNCSLGYEVMKGLVRVIGKRLRDLHHATVDRE